MSRFNISVLLATALLGVLVWIVLSMARDLARAPAEPLPMPSEAVIEEFDPALPHIRNVQDLKLWLDNLGLSGAESLAGYQNWLEDRGFSDLRQHMLSPSTLEAALNYVELDGATLLVLAGRGNTAAMHELADRSLQSDPLAAMEWYDQAVINGSVYAMERMADLLLTLSDPNIAGLPGDDTWKEGLAQINNGSPAPRERALAWSIAAVTVGGYAIMTPEQAERITSLSQQIDLAGVDRACETAQSYVLSTAAERRSMGGAVFLMQAPPMAISIANPAGVIPCDVPVPPLVSLEHCETADFVGPGPRLMTAWLCPG